MTTVVGTDKAATAVITAVDSSVNIGFLRISPPAEHGIIFTLAGLRPRHALWAVPSRTSAFSTRKIVFPCHTCDADRRFPSGGPALLFCNDQELWLCGPASQRVCPSTLAVRRKLRRSLAENKRYGLSRSAARHKESRPSTQPASCRASEGAIGPVPPASPAASETPCTGALRASRAPACSRTPTAPAAAATSGSTRSVRRSAARRSCRGRRPG